MRSRTIAGSRRGSSVSEKAALGPTLQACTPECPSINPGSTRTSSATSQASSPSPPPGLMQTFLSGALVCLQHQHPLSVSPCHGYAALVPALIHSFDTLTVSPANQVPATASQQASQQVFCGNAPFNSRILSGSSATAGRWPWMASLQKNGSHVCGGTLVSVNAVLSNANCFSR